MPVSEYVYVAVLSLLALAVWAAWRRNRARLDDAGVPGGAELAARLARAGLDPARPVEVSFHLDLPDLAAARRCAEQLRADGWTAEASAGEDGDRGRCVALDRIVPRPETIGAACASLEAVAARHGGTLDGWEIALPG
jgi:hypothetical protein